MEINGSLLAPGLAAQPAFPLSTPPTDREAQGLVVPGINGLALLCTAAFGLSLEGNPAQLKEDVPLGLLGTRGAVSLDSGSSRTPAPKAAWGYRAPTWSLGSIFVIIRSSRRLRVKTCSTYSWWAISLLMGRFPRMTCWGWGGGGECVKTVSRSSCQLAQTAVAAMLPADRQEQAALQGCQA